MIRKVDRTKESLRKALIQLIEEEGKDFERIKIYEVVALAGVTRTTFYVHYESIYHLLGDCLLNGWGYEPTLYDAYESGDPVETTRRRVLNGLRYFERHSQIAVVALKQMAYSPYMLWVKNILFSTQRDWISEFDKSMCIDEQTQEALSSFQVNGAIGLIVWWLERGFREVTAEALTETFLGVFFGGMSYFYRCDDELKDELKLDRSD